MTWTSNSFPHGDWISVACSSNGSTVVLSDQSGQSLVSYDSAPLFQRCGILGPRTRRFPTTGPSSLSPAPRCNSPPTAASPCEHRTERCLDWGRRVGRRQPSLRGRGQPRFDFFLHQYRGLMQSVRVASSSSGAYFSSVACSADGSIVLAGCGLEGYGRFLSTNAGATWIGDLAKWPLDRRRGRRFLRRLPPSPSREAFPKTFPFSRFPPILAPLGIPRVWPYSTWSVLAALGRWLDDRRVWPPPAILKAHHGDNFPRRALPFQERRLLMDHQCHASCNVHQCHRFLRRRN